GGGFAAMDFQLGAPVESPAAEGVVPLHGGQGADVVAPGGRSRGAGAGDAKDGGDRPVLVERDADAEVGVVLITKTEVVAEFAFDQYERRDPGAERGLGGEAEPGFHRIAGAGGGD